MPFPYASTRLAPALLLAAATMAVAPPALAQVDYATFEELTRDVSAYRATRLLPLAEWQAKAAESGALILDTRSAAAYRAGHIEGAVNLPFSDFTDEKLAEVVGTDRTRTILIYCNNNFSDDVAPVLSKRAPLALNIPTFINLVGSGYRNVWELDAMVSMADPAVRWTGEGAALTLSAR